MIDGNIGNLLTIYRVWSFPIRFRITPAQPDSRLRWAARVVGPSNQDPAAG